MYKVLDKDTIKNKILPHLSVAKRGYICQSSLSEAIQCILYKLKTGCQWYMLPVSSFFTAKVLHYKTVYGHFRKWCKKGEWQKVWTILLGRYKSFLDMSSIDFDGSHTTALRGGDCQSYQGRKKRKTTILNFMLTKANVDDQDENVFNRLTDNVFGKLFTDKGYISQGLFERLFNDELKNVAQLVHSRHRSIFNFAMNVLSAIAAYSFFEKKPAVNIDFAIEQHSGQLTLF